jgi:lysophospholipase L1-like esterase
LKTILCYGDSLTWGYNPNDGTRYKYAETWPGVLQASLGNGYRVIAEAVYARTTCWELPYVPYRSGKDYLPIALEAHSPLDLVIIMLGLNDLMKLCGKSADESAWGLLALTRIIQSPVFGGNPPKILIIAPPALGKLSPFMEMAYGGKEEESKKLAGCYKIIAEVTLSGFMDSNKFIHVSDVDGVHPLPDQYKILGEAVADKVKQLLITND